MTGQHPDKKSERTKVLPDGWRWVKLGEVCKIKGGKRLPSGTNFAEHATPYPYIRVVDFQNGTVKLDDLKHLDEETHKQIKRYIIDRDDVYISIAGSIGIAGVITDSLHGANLTENAARLIIQDKGTLLRDFLALLLRSPIGQESIKLRTNTVGQPKLALERISTIEILLPPLPEQKRIVEILNEQMGAIEKARKAIEAQLEAAKTLPASYLRAVFNSSEAQQWPRKKLKEVGHFDSGGTPSKENANYWDGDIPFVTGADITDFYITKNNARAFLTYEGLTSGKTAICNEGTLLLVTRTRVGRVGIAKETMGASQDLSPYNCGPNLIPEYVCRYLINISSELLSGCRGATIQGLTRDFISALEMPYPPLIKQQRIAIQLSEQMASTEKLRQSLESQLAAINALPAVLLRRAFSGEL